MKVYIAGKITGDESYRAKFERAARALEGEGHVALNPAILPDGLTEENYIQIAIAMLNCADVAAFLPDWEDSEGARIERAYCQRIGKPCYSLEALAAEKKCKTCAALINGGRCYNPLGAQLGHVFEGPEEMGGEAYINVSEDDFCSAWEPRTGDEP